MKEDIVDIKSLNFGPHIEEHLVDKKRIILTYFKIEFPHQKVSKNLQFMRWKSKCLKYYDLVVECPKCHCYFPTLFTDLARCTACGVRFCLDCKRTSCNSECRLFCSKMMRFYGLKEFQDRSLIEQICIFFITLMKFLFCFPLIYAYKYFPKYVYHRKYENFMNLREYRNNGLFFLWVLFPYQIAYIWFYFCVMSASYLIPSMCYPPLPLLSIGILRYVEKRTKGGKLYEPEGSDAFSMNYDNFD